MMKKAYICAHAKFPRNDASANYIYNLAKCLQTIDYNVTVISRGYNREEDWCGTKQCYMYHGICYDNIGECPQTRGEYVREYFCESKRVLEKLKKSSLAEEDCIFLYTINFFYIKDIYEFAKKKNIHIYTCITEHHQSFQYKWEKLNPVFWLDRAGFRFGIPISGKAIVISQYLHDYFERIHCKAFILPPLVDSKEYNEYAIETRRQSAAECCNIIYSGNPSGKDDMNIMTHAIFSVNKKNCRKIIFHIAGCSEETVKKNTDFADDEWNDFRNNLCIHPWMKYEELIKLYWSMDFFMLARPENKVTLANFPSKVPELMACGVIPIVSDVGDYTKLYIRNGQNGIVFQGCTVEGCAEAIERAVGLTEKDRRVLSYNAREMVRNKFDYRMWGERIREFL